MSIQAAKVRTGIAKRGARPASPAQATRPAFPSGYGLEKSAAGLLAWNWAERRLKSARNYWIATTGESGRPHSMPVWGVWLDGTLYFCTDRSSKKARNLLKHPVVSAHLESGDETVIIEGVAVEEHDSAALERINRSYAKKYRIDFNSVPGDVVVYGVVPEKVFAWREKDFTRSASRWILAPADGSTRKKKVSKKK